MSSKSLVSRHIDRSLSVDSRKEHKPRSRSRSSSVSTRRHKSKDHKGSKEKHKKSKKKKHKRKSSSSSSSSTSDSDEEELKLLQRLEAERQRLKEEKKKQKEEMKAKETPEEKRARRLREKQEKERKRRERMGWDTEYQCYTDQDNPFGDSTLTNTFVWNKKLAKEGVTSVSTSQLEALNRQKQMENKIELEKVKQRRLEREAERAAREAEAAAAARAREAQQLSSWERSEDAFHLTQARLRSQIRIRDGRAKPIDLLAWYVSSEAGVEALEMHEPYACLRGLPAPDLEDLLADIHVYKQLEGAENQSYWSDVETIVKDELSKLTPSAPRHAVHRSVGADVTQIFKGKSGAQLAALAEQIAARLAAPGPALDVGYWECLRSQLSAHMARARLRERHQQALRRKLQVLKQQASASASANASANASASNVHKSETSRSPSPQAKAEVTGETTEENAGPSGAGAASGEGKPEVSEGAEGREASGGEGEGEAKGEEETGRGAAQAAYRAGRYSPPPASPPAPPAAAATQEDDAAARAYRRAHVLGRLDAGAGAGAAGAAGAAAAEAALGAALGAAGAASSAGGAAFSVEHALPAAAPAWSDKYRPRKPRYFNRVHTGFEWNKYNQTHYDMDNPPPKIVQGYKFNIFYPDLISAATPTFSLKPCPDNPEFSVLRFTAGPPYEDIAFKIVNREWEYSYKRGFRCHFHNNVFQLWFHFKRYRYRR